MKRTVMALLCMVATAGAQTYPVSYDGLNYLSKGGGEAAQVIISATNNVLVGKLSDIDNPMLPNTTYQINGTIVATGTIITADNVFIKGDNFFTDGILNASTNTLLAGTNTSIVLERCFLSSPFAPILDLVRTSGTRTFSALGMNMVSSQSIGCITDYAFVVWLNSVIYDMRTTNSAFTACGDVMEKFYMVNTIWNQQTNDLTMINLGTSVCDFVQLDSSQFFTKSSNTVVLAGLTNSLNISPVNGRGAVRGCVFTHTNGDHVVQSDIVTGITKADDRWWFSENANLTGSKIHGGLQATNETAALLTQDVWTNLPGVFFEVPADPVERFTFTTNGVITLGGTRDTTVHFSLSMVVNPDGVGLNKSLEFAMFKNDVAYPYWQKKITLSSKTGGSSVGWLARVPMEVGDSVQAKVRNVTDSSDLDVFQTFADFSGE